ncbi:MAG: ABC transporter permease [Christensenellales bacterium]|jgi:peptide/nickel transport system permease protein
MLKYIVKRILILIPVFICITIILFGVTKIMPGDPVKAMLPTSLKAEQYQLAYNKMYAKLGLDKSIPEQYVRWLVNFFQGDFGFSTKYNREVKLVIGEPIRNSVILNFFVIILELAIAIPVGIRCATKRFSLYDNFWQVFSLVTYSMPSFFLGLSLISIFAIKLDLLPMGGMPNSTLETGFAYILSWLKYVTLPAITLTIISLAGTIRYVRNAMIECLSQDYIRTARAKGLNERVVVYSHAFRNALIPVSTIVVFTIFSLFSGSAITETIFGWHGIGKVLVEAVNARDTQLIVTLNAFFAFLSVIAVLIADVVYGLVDPRIKLS